MSMSDLLLCTIVVELLVVLVLASMIHRSIAALRANGATTTQLQNVQRALEACIREVERRSTTREASNDPPPLSGGPTPGEDPRLRQVRDLLSSWRRRDDSVPR
jgi:hypothetical protein